MLEIIPDTMTPLEFLTKIANDGLNNGDPNQFLDCIKAALIIIEDRIGGNPLNEIKGWKTPGGVKAKPNSNQKPEARLYDALGLGCNKNKG